MARLIITSVLVMAFLWLKGLNSEATAQVGKPGAFEKYEFQPETWSLPEFSAGEADIHGNYNTKIDLLSISSPSGITVPVSFSYSSDIRYADPAGWIGLGWRWNPGSVTRSVMGSMPVTDINKLDGADYYYDELYAYGANGVDLASNMVTRFDVWDGYADIYSMTLPDGRSTKFVLKILETPRRPSGGSDYHEFVSLTDHSWQIRGYFDPAGNYGRVDQCRRFIENSLHCAENLSYDYYAIIIRDASGTQYVFADPTRELYSGKNGYKSEYYNSWRITAIVSPSEPDWVNAKSTISLTPNTIKFYYTNLVTTDEFVSESSHQCRPNLYRTAISNQKYLNKIETVNQEVIIDLKPDTDNDATKYLSHKLNPSAKTESNFVLTEVARRRINKITHYFKEENGTRNVLSDWLVRTDSYDGRTFLDALTNSVTSYNYWFWYSGIETADPGFEFNVRKYLLAGDLRYEPLNSNWDINGYYKKTAGKYSNVLNPGRGQLEKIEYPTGKVEKIYYSNEEIFLNNIFSIKTAILDKFVDVPSLISGNMTVNYSLYFGTETNPEIPQSILDHAAFLRSIGDNAGASRSISDYITNHTIIRYFGKSRVDKVVVKNANQTKEVTKNLVFSNPLFIGMPREINFQDKNAILFNGLPLDQSVMIQGKDFNKASKYNGTDDQVWYKTLQINETGKPIETRENIILSQDHYLIIGPYGGEKFSSSIFTVNYEELQHEAYRTYEFENYLRGAKKIVQVRNTQMIPAIIFPKSIPLNWQGFGNVYASFPEPEKILTYDLLRYPSEDLTGIEFTLRDDRNVDVGKATFTGMNQAGDSAEYVFNYSFMGRKIYQEYEQSNQLAIPFQEISGILKLKGVPTESTNFPWTVITDLFPQTYKSYVGSSPISLPSGLTITGNTVSLSSKKGLGFYPTATFRSKSENHLLFSQNITPSTPNDIWVFQTEIPNYNSFGKPTRVETKFLVEETFYGSSTNPFSQNPSANNWYKATGKIISNADGTISSRISATYDSKNRLNTAANDYQSFSFTYDIAGRLTEVRRGQYLVAKNEYHLLNASLMGEQTVDNHFNYIKKYKYFHASPDSFICEAIFHDGLIPVQKLTGTRRGGMVSVSIYNKDWKTVGETVPMRINPGTSYQYDFALGVNQIMDENLSQKVNKGVLQAARLSPFPESSLIEQFNADWSDTSRNHLGFLPFGYTHKSLDQASVRSRKPGADFLENNAWNALSKYRRGNMAYQMASDEDRQIVRLSTTQPGGRIWSERVLSLNLTGVRLFTINQVTGKINDPALSPDNPEFGSELNSSTLYYDIQPGYGLFLGNLSNLAAQFPGKPFSIRVRDFHTKEVIISQSVDVLTDSLVVPLIPGKYYVDMYADFDKLVQTGSLGITAQAFRYEDLKTIQQVSYGYDRYGRVSVVTHPDGKQTRYVTDFWGNVVKKESPYHNAKIKNGSLPESDVIANPDFEYQYDHWGRVRFIIDPNMSAKGKMLYTKYDFLGRPLEIGEMDAGSNFNLVNANNPEFPVTTATNTKSSGVSSASTDLPNAWVGLSTAPNGVKPLQKMYYDLNTTLHGKPANFGLGRLGYAVEYIPVTASKYKTVRRYYNYSAEGYCTEVNTIFGTDQQRETYSQHDLMGRFKHYQLTLNSSILMTRWIDYHPLGQVMQIWQSETGTKPSVPTLRFEYNDFGNLVNEFTNGQLLTETLRDIRGWVHKISAGSHFNEELYYHLIPEDFQPGSPGTESFPVHFNGNISFMKSKQSAFATRYPETVTGFEYDKIGRLIASRTLNANGDEISLFNTDFRYDIMGNILSQAKNGLNLETGQVLSMDDMVYQYADGRLMNVVDRIDTDRTDDYETVKNSIIGSGDAMFVTTKPVSESFDAFGVKTGARPVSETWDATGFYGANDPASSVSTVSEGGDIVLKLKPSTEFTSSSIRSTLQPVTARRQYIVSGNYKGKPYFNGEVNVNPKIYVGIEWLRSNGSRISVKWIVANKYSSSWKFFSGAQAAPDYATHARIILVNMTSPNTEVYFNDIGFSEDGLAFTYDGNGNTIKDLNRNIASIQYNFLNLPEMITKTDQSSFRYGYSWSGQRLLKMIGTDTTVYIRTATGEIAGEYTNSSSALSYLNILSMDNSASGQRRKEAGSWKSYFYVKDHLGNIRATIRVEGSTQTCVSATDYYPFGSVAREMNATTDENVKFRYQGKERDIETGYDYFEARTYDSQLGRFMQVDPMWESFAFFNSNVAMNNNPLIIIDPTGENGENGNDSENKRDIKKPINPIVNFLMSMYNKYVLKDKKEETQENVKNQNVPKGGYAPIVPLNNTLITSNFSEANRNVTTNNGSQSKPHKGVDLRAKTGTPVLAVNNGVVSSVNGTPTTTTDYGLSIVLNHANNYQTLYGHLSQSNVSAGDTVAKGDTLGLSGNSGNTSGPHLHFEVRYSGEPVSPEKYVYGLITLKVLPK